MKRYSNVKLVFGFLEKYLSFEKRDGNYFHQANTNYNLYKDN